MQTFQQQIDLADGVAVPMGEGVFVICQKDERGAAQSVVLTGEDLTRLVGAK
jgi:hypothetical protein